MDKMQFETNVPQTIALKYANGKRVDSRYNEYEVYYSLVDSPPLYASPALDQKIREFEPRVGQPFSVCKREIKDGNKKRIEWQVLPVNQPGQQVSRPAAPEQTTPRQNNAQNGPTSHQHTAPAIPAQATLTQLYGGALVAAIDALAAAREYGKTQGFALDFNEEDVRTSAASIFIQYFRDAENKARAQAYQSGAVNGGTAWRQ